MLILFCVYPIQAKKEMFCTSCQSLLVLFLLSLAVHGSIGQVYFIVPSENYSNCTHQQCLTLSQFAAISNNGLETNSSIELILLSGTHTLTESITVHDHSGNFLMYSTTSAAITCGETSNLSFINVTGYVQIMDLKFIGCGSNRIENVEIFVMNNSRFDGQSKALTALHFVESNSQIINCTFTSYRNGTYRESLRTLVVLNSSPDFSHTFGSNSATVGGAIIATHSTIHISDSDFSNNSAQAGGAIFAEMGSEITIMDSRFVNNTFILVNSIGGAVHIEDSTANIGGDSLFSNNQAFAGGAIAFFVGNGTIFDGNLTSNSAVAAGTIYCYNGSASIKGGHFSKNSAYHSGGVIYSLLSEITMSGNFYENRAVRGAVLYVEECRVQFESSSSINITDNLAQAYATMYLAESTGLFTGNITMINNKGTLVIFNSNVTFVASANIVFINCHGVEFTLGNVAEGGAITTFQSNIVINGVSKFYNNFAETGGAVHLTESTLYVNGQMIITNNTAVINGGGVYLYQSEISCQQRGTLIISDNKANENGGGIFAVSSTIKVTTRSYFVQGASLEIINNSAKRGGGIFLQANAKIYVFKTDTFQDVNSTMYLISNSASYGGAVYVDDSTNFGTCVVDSTSECFFQVMALHQFPVFDVTHSISFSGNSAVISGSAIFGGLLDRCTVSPFAEIHNVFDRHYENSIEYLRNTSDAKLDSISSRPARVCFCVDNLPQCNDDYRGRPIKVMKGETFSLYLVAIDHVHRTVDATIQSSLTFTESGLGDGQLMQRITNQCSSLTFSVSSPHTHENLTLYAANGPCRDAELSRITIDIEFVDCSCPLGFQVSRLNTSSCMCECHQQITDVTCNITTQSLMKLSSSTAWFSYINSTNIMGYLYYPNCPYDYCTSGNVSVNLNELNGADMQCAFQRSGKLCGSCQQNFSLSLGSSRCLSCPNYWQVLFVSVTVAGIVAGIALVFFILILNMTVSVGTLNGLIFYANIVAAYRSILLPFSKQNFITVLISWLNLDFGFDLCYFPGMDAYSKTWLQLTFPLYIAFLVVMILVLSSCSTKFANLIGKKNPVATLATLVLLSYTKLLTFVLAALTFGTLEFPDGSHVTVWLPDATVTFLDGKHIALFITAVMLLLIGMIFTALLFSWQWLLHLQKWKIFKIVRNTRLISFIECYHAPYTPKHRYWTGLLLFVRIILVLSAQINTSNDPRVALSTIVFIMGIILFLKGVVGIRVYKDWPLDTLEMLFYFNIICLTALTVATDHPASAYMSVCISFTLLLIIILYQVYTYTNVFIKFRESSVGNRLKELFTTNLSKERVSKDDDVYRSHELLDMIDIDRPKEPTHSFVDFSTADVLTREEDLTIDIP